MSGDFFFIFFLSSHPLPLLSCYIRIHVRKCIIMFIYILIVLYFEIVHETKNKLIKINKKQKIK